MKKFYSSALFVFLLICTACFAANAAPDTLKAGSFIINMGVVPQTIGNGLKPYGLVYDLVENHKVPVRWVINGAKAKDGIDFTHNGVQYRGGTFIIPFEFRTPTVNSVISAWQARGVVGNTSVSDLILTITKTLFYAPNWTLDKQNGRIAAAYFVNAGIPASAHGGDSVNWKNPGELNACDDIFVMPHADPTWATHSNLYYWNQTHKGNIWAACHAVSELENLRNPSNTIQMNFLSLNGLVLWSDHRKDGTPPYLYANPGHPVMQFMQVMDNAMNVGSEQVYLPKILGGWRSSTSVSVYDNSSIFIPILSPGPPAVVAYGRAYGDPNRGYVMYEAGHDHNTSGSVSERVAAQRAFFNYSFFVAVDRYAQLNTSIEGLPEIILGNQTYNLSFDVPAGIDLNNYTVTWSSSAGGTFTSTGNKQSIVFTAPVISGATIVSVTITDGCGREVFSSSGAYVGAILPSPVKLQGSYQAEDASVQLKWTETNNESVSHYEIQRAENSNSYKTVALFFPEEKSGQVSYSYTDKQVPQGNNKYRLKIINTSRTVSYSNTVKINTIGNSTTEVSVLGNPTRGVIAFEYTSSIAENITAVVMDMNGRIVISKKLMAQKGTSIVQMGNLSNQPAGMYLLKVMAGTRTIVSHVNLVK
jgi:hypothetical protein